MKIKSLALAALSAFMLLTACNNNDDPTPPTPTPPVVAKEFHVLTTETTPYTATVRVSPTTERASATAWAIQIFSKKMVEDYGGGSVDELDLSAEGCALAMLDVLMSNNPTATPEQLYNALTNNGNMKGTKTVLLSELGVTNPGETCYALTVGLDKELSFTTNPQFDAFTMENLPQLEQVECSFQFKVTPADNGLGALLDVQPEKGDVRCLANMLSKKEFDELGGEEAFADVILPALFESFATQLKTTIIDAVAQTTFKGNAKRDFAGQLDPETDYVAFVCAVDQYGRAISAPVFESFTTLSFKRSAAILSDAKILLFDGNEIDVVAYPNLEGFAGVWFLYLVAEKSPEVAYWTGIWSEEDYVAGEEKLDEGVFAQAILRTTSLNPASLPGLAWGPLSDSHFMEKQTWGYAVGITEDYAPGNVCQTPPFVVSESNKSPISELYKLTGAKSSTLSLFSSFELDLKPATYKMSFVAAE